MTILQGVPAQGMLICADARGFTVFPCPGINASVLPLHGESTRILYDPGQVQSTRLKRESAGGGASPGVNHPVITIIDRLICRDSNVHRLKLRYSIIGG